MAHHELPDGRAPPPQGRRGAAFSKQVVLLRAAPLFLLLVRLLDGLLLFTMMLEDLHVTVVTESATMCIEEMKAMTSATAAAALAGGDPGLAFPAFRALALAAHAAATVVVHLDDEDLALFSPTAAIGMDRLLRGPDRHTGTVGAAGLVVSLVAAVLVSYLFPSLAMAGAGTEPPIVDVAIRSVVVPGFIVVGLLLATSLVVLVYARQLLTPMTASLILLSAHTLTLLGFMTKVIPTVSPGYYQAVPPPVASILAQPQGSEPYRVYWEPSETPLHLPARTGSAAELAFAQRMLGFEFVAIY